MKRPIGLSNPWGKTGDLLHPLVPNGERVCAWGGALSLGESSQQIHCCPLLEASWEKMARRPGLESRPLKICWISMSHGSSRPLVLFCFSVVLGWGLRPSETWLGREIHTSMYLLWMDFQVQICQPLMFKKQCIWQIQVSPLSSSASGDPTGTSYLSEGQ